MPDCPKCGRTLFSHAGRDHKYFHQVAFGPYDGSGMGTCSIDGMAFETDGSPVQGSDEDRMELVESIHGDKRPVLDDVVGLVRLAREKS